MIFLEKILFYFLIFCLPFQTRKLFYQWGDGFNEWTSAYLYFTDILILLVLLLWLWRKRKERFLKNPSILCQRWVSQGIKSPVFWLTAFLIVSLISLVNARNIQLGFYQWFKLLEMAGLFFYLRYNFSSLFSFRRLAQVFIASGFIQSIIAIGQYVSQKSLGLKFLFESPLSAETPGVAKFLVDGIKTIRPYGTFPHPNVLAIFLLVSIFFFYYLWLSKKRSFFGYCFLSVINFGLVLALFLTFSRTVIAVFLIASLIYFITAFWRFKKKVFVLFLLFTVLCSLFVVFAWPEISSRFSISLTEQSVVLRGFYNQTAFLSINEHSLLGIGFGNFVWEIRQMFDLLTSWAHQPVHNIYLLIASETGLIGLIVFLMFLFQLFRRGAQRMCCLIIDHILLITGCCFLFIALFDHFFWTLQQGQLMFWLILGLIAVKKKAP